MLSPIRIPLYAGAFILAEKREQESVSTPSIGPWAPSISRRLKATNPDGIHSYIEACEVTIIAIPSLGTRQRQDGILLRLQPHPQSPDLGSDRASG